MIQDIEPHQFLNCYKSMPPDKESVLLYYEDNQVLAGRTKQGEIYFPVFGEMERSNDHIYGEYVYLFTIDESRYYLVEHINRAGILEFQMEDIEIFREISPRYLAFAGITGAQLWRWYQNRRFCGRCGNKMKKDTKERMLFCESCGQQEYPKIMPAVIIGITDKNRILLTKYVNSAANRYALVAGFTEIGETIEETVKREVMEEVGLTVKNIRFYKSQPWSFSDTLLMGFYAEVDGDDKITLEEEELEMAQWFDRTEIPVKPTSLSLTNEMIMKFKEGMV